MRNLFLLGLAIGLFVSCETKEDPELQPTENTIYFPLLIGNYWVYQHYDIDPQGFESTRGVTDSVVIARDTLIGGHQYFILEGSNYPYHGGSWVTLDVVRDSSGYIVNKEGVIRFSQSNFTDILASKTEVIGGDTLYTLNYQMDLVEMPYTVPAGDFDVLNYKGTVITYAPVQGVENPRYMNTLFSKGVGKVLETYFFLNSPRVSEKRLIRYHIENQD